MNKHDKALLEKYAQAIFGCSADDLEDREYDMLVAHVAENEPSFLNHRGIMEWK